LKGGWDGAASINYEGGNGDWLLKWSRSIGPYIQKGRTGVNFSLAVEGLPPKLIIRFRTDGGKPFSYRGKRKR